MPVGPVADVTAPCRSVCVWLVSLVFCVLGACDVSAGRVVLAGLVVPAGRVVPAVRVDAVVLTVVRGGAVVFAAVVRDVVPFVVCFAVVFVLLCDAEADVFEVVFVLDAVVLF